HARRDRRLHLDPPAPGRQGPGGGVGHQGAAEHAVAEDLGLLPRRLQGFGSDHAVGAAGDREGEARRGDRLEAAGAGGGHLRPRGGREPHRGDGGGGVSAGRSSGLAWYGGVFGGLLPILLLGFIYSALADRTVFALWALVAGVCWVAVLRQGLILGWRRSRLL